MRKKEKDEKAIEASGGQNSNIIACLQGIATARHDFALGLGRLGGLLGVDRIGLVLFGKEALTVNYEMYWNSEKWLYDENSKLTELAEYPWLVRRIKSGATLVLKESDIQSPDAFSEYEYLKNYGIRQMMVRPLRDDLTGEIGGFWHFDDMRDNTCEQSSVWQEISGIESAVLAIAQLRQKLLVVQELLAEKNIMLDNSEVQMWYMLNPSLYGGANRAHAQFFAKTCAEMVKREINSLYDDASAGEFFEMVWSVFKNKQKSENELTLKNALGEKRILLISLNPVLKDTDEVRYVICVAQDITDLKKLNSMIDANLELSRMNEKLSIANLALQKEIRERKKTELRLAEAYDELKKTQMQMIQQEKMAGIGQLAAGVAHEINNPMGFIISNLDILSKYIAKLKLFWAIQKESLLLVQSDEYTKEAMRRLFERSRKSAEENDLDYLFEDMTEMLEDMKDGALRVKKIVQNLSGFARFTEDVKEELDVNENLEKTIGVIGNELKYKAALIKEFGNLPLIKGNSGQLNQVFLNIIFNAIQAIKDKGEIKIRTSHLENAVLIEISDTGHGMDAKTLERIFEPFFTTKEIGQGTGLGLSISYAIIEEHGGRIEVESEVGKGTVFKIFLPCLKN